MFKEIKDIIVAIRTYKGAIKDLEVIINRATRERARYMKTMAKLQKDLERRRELQKE